MIRVRRVMEFFWMFAEWKWGYGKDEKKRFRFKMAFITLTLSSEQKHTDDYIKQHMLEPFLKWAFREGKDKHYVWKAEVQKNANIHFHITFNGFLHYLKIRQKWNHLQYKHGYISADADPNSTDVHSVKHTKGFIGYMSKYMSKTTAPLDFTRVDDLFVFDQGAQVTELMYGAIAATNIPFYSRPIEGKHWACDRKLLNCSARIVVRDSDPPEEWQEKVKTLQEIHNEHLKMMKCERIKTDFVTIWKHERDIHLDSQLIEPVADLFADAYRSFIGLS